MGIEVWNFESQKYRKLFEFMKQYGIEPFLNFFDEYNDLRRQDLARLAVLNGKHETLSFTRKHAEVLRKIREFAVDDDGFLFNDSFMGLVSGVTDTNLLQYIDGAYALECLGVSKIFLLSDKFFDGTDLYFENGSISDIIKIYTNGNIRYEEGYNCYCDYYRTFVDFEGSSTGNFVIRAENHANGLPFRYAHISDFGFDSSLLPTNGELSSYEPPRSLVESKVYVKR